MGILRFTDPDFEEVTAGLCRRAEPDGGVRAVVESILEEVRTRGDEALVEFGKKFDGAVLEPGGLRVSPAEFEEASGEVGEDAKALVAAALENVHAFAKKSLRADWWSTNAQGRGWVRFFSRLRGLGCISPEERHLWYPRR